MNTILKLESRINSNIAEKILGHKNGLDGVYLTPTRQECFKEFVKGINQLTISDTNRKQIEITRIIQEKSELEKKIPDLVNQAVRRIKSELRQEGWQISQQV